MKRLYSILAAALLFAAVTPSANAAVEVSVDFFHDNLEPYGDWREVGDYGYCWQPRNVDRDWRPYSDGRWLYTDAGWTWDSDEPYSWAVYHYGRWANVDRVGWVWVPGREWAPAWVSWRRSERHVGWAPLPPEARFSRTSGFGGRVDAEFDIGPASFRFVQVRDFGSQRLRTHFIEPRENITIINQTTNITQITYVNNVVHNEGPRYDAISRESAEPIRRLKLDRRQDFGGNPRSARAEDLRTQVEGDSYRVMAPSFDEKPATAPRKLAKRVENVEVDRGWKNSGPPDQVEKLRAKIKSEPADRPDFPPEPKAGKIVEVPAEPVVPGTKPGKGGMRKGDKTDQPEVIPGAGIPDGGNEHTKGKGEPGKKGKMLPEPKAEKPAKAPGEFPLPGDKPKGKTRNDDKPDKADPPSNPTKKAKPDADKPRPSPAAPEKGSKKDREANRPAEQPAPKKMEPKREPQPAREEAPRKKDQTEKRTKSEQPARRAEPARPDKSQPREQTKKPESRKPSTPESDPTDPTKSGKGKGKGKGKDDKKGE